jgi:hypothetical protein
VANDCSIGLNSTDTFYLELFGTGFDSATARQVTVTINGQSVPVLFAGAQQQYPGLDQINVGPLPANLKGAGTVNVEVSVNGQAANTVTLTWALPQPSLAVRRQLSYDSGGRPNQLTYLYTPVAAGAAPLPTLLAVYPGAADTWEGVSIPLAAAGYAVVAVGPAYALDLEDDIAELQRLVAFARAGALPGADGARMALLGGSYSSLHVQALLERDSGFRGVVLLGGISDIFDMRRRFEHGSFVPPFGLDQALIALGTPDISPERPWRYSSRFHLRRGLPPMLLMQYVTGASRPGETTAESHWKPFNDNNGVSGHAFMGALPFINAAKMTDELPLKIGFYACSAFAGWSRINDDAHYTSQVVLGWWMAYWSATIVDMTDHQPHDWIITPLPMADGAGMAITYQY